LTPNMLAHILAALFWLSVALPLATVVMNKRDLHQVANETIHLGY